jgi:lysophospholipase L1-like esterase
MRLNYFLGAIVAIPLLPIMYVQAKNIRKKVPQLPEATGFSGKCIINPGSSKKLTLLSLGESTVAGIGVQTHEEGFTGTFTQTLAEEIQQNIDWKVYAKSGYTAKLVLKKLVPKITEKNPDIILIGLGGNDSFTLNRPWTWKKDIQNLIKALKSRFPEATLVFANMPPIKEFPAFTSLIKFVIGNLVEILGHELKSLEKSYEKVIVFDEIITLDVWSERYQLAKDPALYFSDGVHPSKLTYQTWAKDIANRLANIIRS